MYSFFIEVTSLNKRRNLDEIVLWVSYIASTLSPRFCSRGKDRLCTHAYGTLILLVNICEAWNVEGHFHCPIGTFGIGIRLEGHMLESVARK